MVIEKQEKYTEKTKKAEKKITGIRSLLLASLISILPMWEIIWQNNNFILPQKPSKGDLIHQKKEKQDSIRFERQKEHFDVVDKRDLKRDIIVLYHDTINDTYRTKYIYKYSKNRHTRKKITEEEFKNPDKLRIYYNRQYPAEHILIVDEKDDKIDYKKAKQMLDNHRIQARIKKDVEKKKKAQENQSEDK